MLLGVISIIKGVVPKAQIYVEPAFDEETIDINMVPDIVSKINIKKDKGTCCQEEKQEEE